MTLQMRGTEGRRLTQSPVVLGDTPTRVSCTQSGCCCHLVGLPGMLRPLLRSEGLAPSGGPVLSLLEKMCALPRSPTPQQYRCPGEGWKAGPKVRGLSLTAWVGFQLQVLPLCSSGQASLYLGLLTYKVG